MAVAVASLVIVCAQPWAVKGNARARRSTEEHEEHDRARGVQEYEKHKVNEEHQEQEEHTMKQRRGIEKDRKTFLPTVGRCTSIY